MRLIITFNSKHDRKPAKARWPIMVLIAVTAVPACAEYPANLAQLPSAKMIEVSGRTDFNSNTITKLGPGFGLRVKESLNIPLRYVEMITGFYPYDGLARLRGGGCIRFLRKQPGRNELPGGDMTGARIILDPSLCNDLPPPGEGVRAIPCPGDASGSPLAGWYLTCKHISGGRSALIAIGSGTATKGRTVTLAVLDQHVRFFKTFGIHWDGGEVTTLGTSANGRTMISRYTWFARDTGK